MTELLIKDTQWFALCVCFLLFGKFVLLPSTHNVILYFLFLCCQAMNQCIFSTRSISLMLF